MRLTTMTDYALRLLVHVARHPDRLCTIGEVARDQGISEAHLVKVTHLLAQRGLLVTLRGKGGGMRLARPPAEIGIGEVVRLVEPDFQLVECYRAGGSCAMAADCGLAGAMHGALLAFLAHLDRFTLADALAAPTGDADWHAISFIRSAAA